MSLQASFFASDQSLASLAEANMNFSPDVFDKETLLYLKQAEKKRTDVYGERVVLRCERPVHGVDVLRLLQNTQKPMRAPLIAVILESSREQVDTACASLVRSGDLVRDEEAFYSLRPVEMH